MNVEAGNADDSLDDDVFGLRHMALRNALYHLARRRFLDGANRWCSFVIILGGTATAAMLANQRPSAGLVLGGVVTLAGTLQLVFDYAGRARAHEILQRRYFDLLAQIECDIAPTIERCATWKGEFARAAADEPPTMRALDAIADNQATFALLGGSKPRLKVTRWQSLTRHLFAHNGGRFELTESDDLSVNAA